MARVSIIIPTRNRAAMLQKAIASAKNAGEDVEVIVVDDASSDETPSICRQWGEIVYIRLEKNVGQAKARNVGIAKSSGEFLAFLDDDDLRLAGSLKKQEKLLSRNEKLGFVYGQVQIGDSKHCVPTGEIRPDLCPSGDLFWDLLKGNFIYVPSVLVRKRYFESVGLFDPSIQGTEDWDAWIRLAETYPVDAVQEPVAIYRGSEQGSDQTSANRPKMCRSSAQTLAKALRSTRAVAAEPDIRRKVRSEYMNLLWHNLVSEGHRALSQRKFLYAARNFITAIQLHPRRAARSSTIGSFLLDIIR